MKYMEVMTIRVCLMKTRRKQNLSKIEKTNDGVLI